MAFEGQKAGKVVPDQIMVKKRAKKQKQKQINPNEHMGYGEFSQSHMGSIWGNPSYGHLEETRADNSKPSGAVSS
jgi:hypothetical protein